MSKARYILTLLEQVDSINDYFDWWQPYFSPSDWERIRSLLKRNIGIPFAQLVGKLGRGISDSVKSVIIRKEDPGSSIGVGDTFFRYYVGEYKGLPFVVGGFSSGFEEIEDYLLVKREDQGKWKEEFKGELA